ncbi:MAG: alpha/beta hydrolase [Myxococcales bacterium]|nr:alpha/beta hydrolase [Myxococcales bacterium]
MAARRAAPSMPPLPWLLFALGVSCAAAVAVSLWPPQRPGVLALAVWPVGWLVGELPLHAIVLWTGAGAALAVGGGVEAWPGWVGAGALALALLGLRHHLALAAGTTPAVEQGLVEALGRDYHDRIEPEVRAAYDPTTSWRALATILPVRPREVTRVRDLEYARVDGRPLHLDLFRRDDLAAAGGRPVFVYVHGGGWVIGNKRQQGRLTVHELAAAGWLCVSIDYRLSPRATFPDHLIDVKRALAWVRAHIADHGGDPRFVVIGGGSAGAHLAALAALTANDPAYQPGFADADTAVAGCVAYYGVYDFVDDDRHFRHRAFHDLLLARIVMKAPVARAREAYAQASPVARVTATAPPFLLFHGDRDSLAPVTAARAFAARLRAAGVACAYVELPGAQHAFELFPSLRSVAVVHGTHRFCQAIWCAWRARTGTPADLA